VRVLHLSSGVHEGSSAHRVERLDVKRLVEWRLQQFWWRRIGWWRGQQGLLILGREAPAIVSARRSFALNRGADLVRSAWPLRAG
jgi:hypothetical protein